VRALGIDVAVKKGMDLVVLEGSQPVATHRRVALPDVAPLISGMRPDVVAIDSPPAWALAGPLREAERHLSRLGISSYPTPSPERGQARRSSEWMRVGFEVFRAAAAVGFPRYREGPVFGTAIEVFPYATGVVLCGDLRPSGMTKRAWRSSVLQTHGVDTDALKSMDQIDAALAALTGVLALAGQSTAVGDPTEGVIVLPAGTLPEIRYRRR
jgi:predicted nuclease with RNAse H fold